MKKEGLEQMLVNSRKHLAFYSKSENKLKCWVDNPDDYIAFLDSIRERIKYLEDQLIKNFN